MAQPAHAPASGKRPSLRTHLIGVVDRVPETRGCGVIYRKGNQMFRLRPQGGSGATVMFELHERDVRSLYLLQSKRSTRYQLLPSARVDGCDEITGYGVGTRIINRVGEIAYLRSMLKLEGPAR